MPESVKLNESLGIIEVASFGTVTREDSLQSLREINAYLAQKSAKCVLVDARKQTVSSARAANISKFAEMLPRGVKIALLYTRNHPNDAEITFLAASAIANSVSFRMFEDKDAALAWLKE